MTPRRSSLRTAVAVGIVAVVSGFACGAEPEAAAWMMPRGDIHATGASTVAGPSSAVLRWEATTRITPTVFPLVADARTVYLAGEEPAGGTVIALDLIDGRERWTTHVEEAVTGLMATSDAVYAATSEGMIVKLDPASGERADELGKLGVMRRGWFSGLLGLGGEMSVVSHYATVYAIAENLSRPVWAWRPWGAEEPPLPGLGMPSVTRSGHIVIPSEGLTALSAAGGQLRWQYGMGTLGLSSCAAVDEQDRVFWARTKPDTSFTGGNLVCLHGSTGEVIWSEDLSSIPSLASAVSQGRVVVYTLDGVLSCWSASDGELLWKQRVPPGTRADSGPIIDAAGRVYIGGALLLCYDLMDGEELFRWERPTGIHGIILPGDGSLVGVGLGAVYSIADSAPQPDAEL